jgi:hypothetical protein
MNWSFINRQDIFRALLARMGYYSSSRTGLKVPQPPHAHCRQTHDWVTCAMRGSRSWYAGRAIFRDACARSLASLAACAPAEVV